MSNNETKNDIAFVKELAGIVQENQFSEIEVEKCFDNERSLKVRIIKTKIEIQENVAVTNTNSEAISPKIIEEKPQKALDPLNHPGIISSPMVGTIYLAPEPGGTPFVEVGKNIKLGDTLVIIEAMKTLNQIPSTKEGKITRILVDDGTPVEFGSPLVIIE
jgi:acetyl-CoA carboxylase biotin carboxyl carrier protein